MSIHVWVSFYQIFYYLHCVSVLTILKTEENLKLQNKPKILLQILVSNNSL